MEVLRGIKESVNLNESSCLHVFFSTIKELRSIKNPFNLISLLVFIVPGFTIIR